MKRIVCITALCFASLQPAAFASGNHNLTKALRGDYAFSGDGACLQSNQEWLNGFRTPDGGFTRSHSVRGVRHFNGDGTGTATGRSLSMGLNGFTGHPSAYGPYFTSDFTANFTYTVDADRTIHIVNGPLIFTQFEGPNPGPSGVWTGIEIIGKISQDYKTLVVGTPKTSILEIHYPTLADAQNGTNADQWRHCHRSRTMIRISDGEEKHERSSSRFPF